MNLFKNLNILFLFFVAKAFSIAVSNPSDPEIFCEGIVSKSKNLSLRASYLYDNIFQSEYKSNVSIDAKTDIKMKIFASILKLNILNRLDLYGILGKTEYKFLLSSDAFEFSDCSFAWGAGLKLIIFKGNCFDFSFDGKYFSTKPKNDYFIVEKLVFTLDEPFEQHLEQVQAAIALSYKTDLLIPYIGATFFYTLNTDYFPYSRIFSNPLVSRLNRGKDQAIFEIREVKPQYYAGPLLGISVINRQRNSTLNLELRLINEYAFSFIGTIRF